MIYCFLLLFLISCNTNKPDLNIDKKDKILVKKNISYNGVKNSKSEFCVLLSFDIECSNYYSRYNIKRVVNIPHLTDDPVDRDFSIPDFIVASRLKLSDINLPEKIQKILESYQVFSEDKLDIFWLVQNSAFLGEENDYSSVPTTTRLKAHAWADPDAPTNYKGDRINREFLLGVFDADIDISTAKFPKETMTKSFIYTHDSVFSPRDERNMLKVSSQSPSLSFFSVVIDDNAKDKRAVVTLHWVLKWSDKEEEDLIKIIKDYKEPIVLQEFIKNLEHSKSFKNSDMLKKIQKLLKF